MGSKIQLHDNKSAVLKRTQNNSQDSKEYYKIHYEVIFMLHALMRLKLFSITPHQIARINYEIRSCAPFSDVSFWSNNKIRPPTTDLEAESKARNHLQSCG